MNDVTFLVQASQYHEILTGLEQVEPMKGRLFIEHIIISFNKRTSRHEFDQNLFRNNEDILIKVFITVNRSATILNT